jgi:chemotaxis protein CheY-P-specific phosphatase CheC
VAVSAVVKSVFNTILEQLAEEIGALLGAPVEFSEHRMEVLGKEELFSINRGRSVLSTMVISGDHTGEAFIISDLKDSVVLGGTLIMLPKDQIEENCKLRTFEGEAADAYGEVANIIAGVYTSVFLDMYPEKMHFKRTTVADFVPTQLDPAADLPFPPGEYFYTSCAMALEDYELHRLEVIVPAALLGLGSEPAQAAPPEAEPEPAPAAEPEPAADEPVPEAEEETDDAPPAAEEKPAPKYVDTATADRTLKASLTQCAEEVGGMLGLELELENLSTRYVSKEEYFSRPGKKAIAAEMLITGDGEGSGYFITEVRDAIYFGGTMIMLPAEEIENHIKSGELGEELEDAFGEVANIISGGLVQNFEELYPRKFHLKKGELKLFTPTKVKVEDPEPFPDDEYYQVSATLGSAERDLGEISFLCPVSVLHIAPRPAPTSGWGEPAEEEKTTAKQPAAKPSPDNTEKPAAKAPAAEKPAAIVVVCDDKTMREFFTSALASFDPETLQFATGDNFGESRKYSVLGAFLLLEKVDEQSFAHMIKLRSELPAQRPLIVAGPQWTRSDVIKAVRYGANDIIVTPATEEEIREKVEINLKTTCQ